jgi:Ca2+-binding EF-hand superfamily protein
MCPHRVAGSSRWEFELRSIFEAFDLEGTGTVNKKELREIMRRLGTTDMLY